jgi:methylated-DNA-[protein]-cysteine S-methyltransferase
VVGADRPGNQIDERPRRTARDENRGEGGRSMTDRITIDTPVGTLALEGDDEYLTYIELPGPSVAHTPPTTTPKAKGAPDPLKDAARQLAQYFDGTRHDFELPLAFEGGTDFQQQVWLTLDTIGYGQTISYAELARRVGRPSAFRAVGQANGANPLPIVLPCHRVLASGGKIGGYGGGLRLKRQLLELEGVAPPL